MSVTTKDGTRDYDPDCPCFEPSSGPGGVTNIVGAGEISSGRTISGSDDSIGPSSPASNVDSEAEMAGAGTTGSTTGGTGSPSTAGAAPRIGIGAAHSPVTILLASILTVSWLIR
jgi:hypothetical protein